MLSKQNRRDFLKTLGITSFSTLLGADCSWPKTIASEKSVKSKGKTGDSTEQIPFADWVVGPYLQNSSPNAMTICFVSDHASQVSVMARNVHQKGFISHQAVGVTIPGTSATVWKARLTGLKAGARYEYRINYKANGKDVIGGRCKFSTPSLDSKRTKCIVLNDVHYRTGTVAKLMEHVADHEYEYSILLGDCWNDPRWAGDGRKVMTMLADFIRLLNGSEKPILYVRGNHECRGYFSGKLGYLFDLPNLNPAASYYDQNYYYSFASGPVRFLFCDAGEDGNKRYDLFKPYRLGQAKWLENQIKIPEYRSGKFHVFASHIPLYNSSPWRAVYCQKVWTPVLEKAGIDLAIAGHDHQWRDLKAHRVCIDAECANYKREQKAECPHSPPYPLVIGGGPSLRQGTVMILKADSKTLMLRMQNAEGKVLVSKKIGR